MAETGMSNIQQRVAVGVAGVPLVIWISWMGGAYFFALMLLCSLLAINEFYRLL
ncbi:MAG: phosphatidate cytidylyltransferase, partial [Prosthecochloris sp.]|nr:phosphatidate cytidylyltransferase [Prosthecochloris sp.]